MFTHDKIIKTDLRETLSVVFEHVLSASLLWLHWQWKLSLKATAVPRGRLPLSVLTLLRLLRSHRSRAGNCSERTKVSVVGSLWSSHPDTERTKIFTSGSVEGKLIDLLWQFQRWRGMQYRPMTALRLQTTPTSPETHQAFPSSLSGHRVAADQSFSHQHEWQDAKSSMIDSLKLRNLFCSLTYDKISHCREDVVRVVVQFCVNQSSFLEVCWVQRRLCNTRQIRRNRLWLVQLKVSFDISRHLIERIDLQILSWMLLATVDVNAFHFNVQSKIPYGQQSHPTWRRAEVVIQNSGHFRNIFVRLVRKLFDNKNDLKNVESETHVCV